MAQPSACASRTENPWISISFPPSFLIRINCCARFPSCEAPPRFRPSLIPSRARSIAGALSKSLFFGGLDLKRVEDPDRCPDNGLFVASLLDLAATKLKALWQRAVYKDYFDLDVLLQQGIDLAAALSAARAVYGSGFNPLISLKALAYFEEGDVARLASDAKERLHRAVRGVNLTQLTERSGPFKRLDEGLWS